MPWAHELFLKHLEAQLAAVQLTLEHPQGSSFGWPSRQKLLKTNPKVPTTGGSLTTSVQTCLNLWLKPFPAIVVIA